MTADGTSTVDVSSSPVSVRDEVGQYGWRELSREEIAAAGTKSLLHVVKTKYGVYVGRALVQGSERVGQHAYDYYKLTKEEIATARFFDTTGATLKE